MILKVLGIFWFKNKELANTMTMTLSANGSKMEPKADF